MKKQELLDSNDDIRNDADLITPDEDCDNRDKHVENSYPDIRIETSASPVWTTPQSHSSRPYWLQIAKQGRKVTVSGWFRSTVGTTIPPSKIFTFKDTVASVASDLLPDDTTNPQTSAPFQYKSKGVTPNGTEIQMCVQRSLTEGNGLFSLDNISPNNTPQSMYYFNFTYLVKE